MFMLYAYNDGRDDRDGNDDSKEIHDSIPNA